MKTTFFIKEHFWSNKVGMSLQHSKMFLITINFFLTVKVSLRKMKTELSSRELHFWSATMTAQRSLWHCYSLIQKVCKLSWYFVLQTQSWPSCREQRFHLIAVLVNEVTYLIDFSDGSTEHVSPGEQCCPQVGVWDGDFRSGFNLSVTGFSFNRRC